MPDFRVVASAASSISGGNSLLTSIAIPAEARRGDLIVLALIGAWRVPGDPDLDRIFAKADDDRLRPHLFIRGLANGIEWLSTRETSAYSMVLGDDRTPLDITLGSNDTQFGQFASAKIWALRTADGGGVDVDPGREVSKTWPLAPDQIPVVEPDETLPAVPGDGPGAIGLVFTWRSIVGGLDPDRLDLSRVAPPWRLYGGSSGGYQDVFLLQAGAGEVDEARAPRRSQIVGTHFLALGIVPTAPPVVRQYPRDDGLGLSSAPRLTARGPRSGRVIGSHP